MDAFDIGRLTDFDFEEVCKSLFEYQLNLPLEIFSQGKDKGVDLRHLGSISDRAIIVQCKHWARSKRTTLIKHIQEVELPKVRRLNPARYILATSTELTVDAKDKLANILAPYSAPGDIFGLNDIQALLKSNPRIVESHVRLWLSSAAVLSSLLNRGLLARSAWLREEINESIKTYVPSESFSEAEELLSEEHVCIISGNPGAGKTTLAQVLAATYASRSFDVIDISEDIHEINSVWNDDVPQFFYYDDFLGQSSLDDKLGKNEDGRLLSALKRIQKSNNKRIVLTTREYILRQAQQRYERLSRYDLSPLVCVVDLDRTSPAARGSILYNHIYFSNLQARQIAEFADRDIFGKIVSHKSFNPRIISFILAKVAPQEDPSISIADDVLAHLDHPASLWEHIVENQLDEFAVDLLLVLLTFGPGGALVEDIKGALREYCSNIGSPWSVSRFRRSIDLLEETMLKINITPDGPLLRFHNPSIRDYLVMHLGKLPETVSHLFQASAHFEQIYNLWKIGGRWMGTPLPSRLYHHSNDISDAIIRTLDSSLAYDPQYLLGRKRIVDRFRRLTEALNMSNALKLVNVGSFLKQYLEQHPVNSIDPHTDWCPPMVKALWASNDPQLQDLKEPVLERVIEMELEGIEDWESARLTLGILEEYGDLVPYDALEFIHEEIRRYIKECFGYIEEFGTFEGEYTLETVEDILEYAKGQIGTDSFEVVESAVRRYRLANSLDVPDLAVSGQLPLFDLENTESESEGMRRAIAALAERE
ncbi:restriction endonuclease [Nonomuraea sp. NPDC050547]|uniref:nSTAND3 domain-containing NTPase n=1 Tax=Nonomuraea sp. NPDC050547 TaxID=3364368 RepID=UPI00379D5CD7